MIDVKTAEKLVERYSIKLSDEIVEIEKLEGRVLASSVTASRKQPPFDRVAMDGIAIQFAHLDKNSFVLEGIQKAGTQALKLEKPDGALEVMTGAVLPLNADTVIPYERLDIISGVATLHEDVQVTKAQNIHFEGSDYSDGDVLLEAGLKLNSAAVAIIASQGATTAQVIKFPRLAIVSTGDELVEPGQDCKPWQIWRSNAYAIKAELKEFGIPEENINLYHLEDEKSVVFNALKEILTGYDGLIISGGVSMGKFDFVQAVMSDLGVSTHFYKIKQKPGKPMFFGSAENGTAVFALPGNPVSALMCMRRYVIPSLRKSLSLPSESIKVVLSEDVSFKKEFALFKAVRISSTEDGLLLATPLKSNGSGDFSSLGNSHGFIELPAEDTLHKADNVFKYFPWSGGAL